MYEGWESLVHTADKSPQRLKILKKLREFLMINASAWTVSLPGHVFWTNKHKTNLGILWEFQRFSSL